MKLIMPVLFPFTTLCTTQTHSIFPYLHLYLHFHISALTKHLNITKPLGFRPPLRKMLYLVSFVELSNFDIDIVISNISMYASRHFQQGECASCLSCVDINPCLPSFASHVHINLDTMLMLCHQCNK